MELTRNQIEFKLRDIKESLEIYRDYAPAAEYCKQLWAEWDALIVELSRG
jgi:hypothetical protein